MNDVQNYGIKNKSTKTERNMFLQVGFTVVFALAVAVVPSIATIKFFLI